MRDFLRAVAFGCMFGGLPGGGPLIALGMKRKWEREDAGEKPPYDFLPDTTPSYRETSVYDGPSLSETAGKVWQKFKNFAKKFRTRIRQELFSRCPKLIPTWKTITIGSKTKEELVAEMERKGFSIGEREKKLINNKQFVVLPWRKRLKLARVSVDDLGFTRPPTTHELVQRIKELGHDICPAEVGPHLHLKYRKRRSLGWLNIVMRPVKDSFYGELIWQMHDNLYSGRQRILCAEYPPWVWATAHDWAGRWESGTEIVFVLNK